MKKLLFNLVNFFKKKKINLQKQKEIIGITNNFEVNEKSKNNYSVKEMVIASYIAIYGNENLNMTNAEIARSINRTPKSLANKVYRLKSAIKGNIKIPSKNEIHIVIKLLVSFEEIEHRFAVFQHLESSTHCETIRLEYIKKLENIKNMI